MSGVDIYKSATQIFPYKCSLRLESMKGMSILGFRRGGIVIAAVLVLMYSVAGEMRVGGETE